MAKKTYLDFSLFDEVGDAMDLFGNLIRNSFEYDSFSGKDEFPAIVLTPPVPMDVNQIAAFLPNKKDVDQTRSDDRNLVQRGADLLDDLVETDEEEQLAKLSSIIEDKIPKFTFKARIIGPNSPHQFLPDPCDQQVLKDLKQQQNAQDIFDMHTTVIAIGATEKPSLGDIVTIKLDGGTFSYNLQTATFVRLVTSEEGAIKNLLASQKNECKAGLNSLFAGGFIGTSMGSIATEPYSAIYKPKVGAPRPVENGKLEGMGLVLATPKTDLFTKTHLHGPGNVRFIPEAIESFEKLARDFKKHFGYPIQINSSYRSFDGQMQMKAKHGGGAATPGKSNHGWGVAFDVNRTKVDTNKDGKITNRDRFSSPVYLWLDNNKKGRYGWINPPNLREDGKLPESWHWENTALRDKHMTNRKPLPPYAAPDGEEPPSDA